MRILRLTQIASVAALGIVVATATVPSPAAARTAVDLGIGVPLGGPAYVAPPPVVYAAPPVVAYPAPPAVAYAAPPPVVVGAPVYGSLGFAFGDGHRWDRGWHGDRGWRR